MNLLRIHSSDAARKNTVVFFLALLIVLASITILPKKTFAAGYTWTKRTFDNGMSSAGVASSADGVRLISIRRTSSSNINIYISSDSGVTWSSGISIGNPAIASNDMGDCVASSPDGMKLAVCWGDGHIHTSSNGGTSWTNLINSPNENWSSVSISADGIKLAAVGSGDGILFTSSDSGNSWTSHINVGAATFFSWNYAIRSSQDGSKIAVLGNDSYLYLSVNSGSTWIKKLIIPVGTTTAAAPIYLTSSSDGVNLAASGDFGGSNNPNVAYTSIDGGTTWTGRNIPVATNPCAVFACTVTSITSSSDGKKIIIGDSVSNVRTSLDTGVTWISQAVTSSTTQIASIAASADASKLVASISLQDSSAENIWTAGAISNCPTSLSTTNSGNAFDLLANIANYLINAVGFNFCVTNTSSGHYFVPSKTAAELQSFYNAIPRLNGISTTTP